MINIEKDVLLYQLKLVFGSNIQSFNQISNNIWLGNANAANNKDFLDYYKFHAIFNITDKVMEKLLIGKCTKKKTRYKCY